MLRQDHPHAQHNDAHRLTAGAMMAQEQCVRAPVHGVFQLGWRSGDRAVLVKIAGEAGMEKADVSRNLKRYGC